MKQAFPCSSRYNKMPSNWQIKWKIKKQRKENITEKKPYASAISVDMDILYASMWFSNVHILSWCASCELTNAGENHRFQLKAKWVISTEHCETRRPELELVIRSVFVWGRLTSTRMSIDFSLAQQVAYTHTRTFETWNEILAIR